jgi:hypothetical protein
MLHIIKKSKSSSPCCFGFACCPHRDINLLVWGVDLVEENFMAHVGIPVSARAVCVCVCVCEHAWVQVHVCGCG